MRLPAPRIIAIDDEQDALDGITRGLNDYGAACLPVLFTAEEAMTECAHVRVIFADLHLIRGLPGDHNGDFSIIGRLVEEIKPLGPYLIVLWTQYPEQAENLYQYLIDNLGDVAKPFSVQPLDKADHLDHKGNVKEPKALVGAIASAVAKQPQVGALLNWEDRVLGAAGDTVSSIAAMANEAVDGTSLDVELGRLLRHLAAGSVGRGHVEDDPFRAVNDALLPIVADHIGAMRSLSADDQLWRDAVGGMGRKGSLAGSQAARLNRLLHIVPLSADQDGSERGAVIGLPGEMLGDSFLETFAIAPEKAMEEEFMCELPDNNIELARWVLVQTQAACDYAQERPGPLPFHLGLWLPQSRVTPERKRKPKAALWRSPNFEHQNEIWVLHVNARFSLSLIKARIAEAEPLLRVREQLLNDIIFHLHSYGARPGIISFKS